MLDSEKKMENNSEHASNVDQPLDQEEQAESGQPKDVVDQPDEPSKAADKSSDIDKRQAQQRREKRQQYIADLKEKRKDAQSRLERITKAGESSKEPQEKDYPDIAEYAAARAVWQASQNTREQTRQEAEAELKQLDDQTKYQLDQGWHDATNEARSKFEDFDKIALNPSLNVSDAMFQVISQSEAGPDVLYHLGSNPQLAYKISQLEPLAAAVELGKIEATIKSVQPKRMTKAPEPITPVESASSSQRDPAKMSMEEYRQWRMSGGGR